MPEVNLDQLIAAIEKQHGGNATFTQSVPVTEKFDGKVVWEGTVYIFDLAGHPKATRAYAWSSPVEGSQKRRFFAVPHLEGIRSPQDAVKAAIVAEHRRGGREAYNLFGVGIHATLRMRRFTNRQRK